MSNNATIEIMRDSMERYFNDEEWKQIQVLASTLGNVDLDTESITANIKYDENYIRELFSDFDDLEIRVNYNEPDETFFIGDDE